ncbi:MAG: glycosyltransferase [Verrucomicrobia bacterium]|nr:glycosyltransferase [Verrucomicrobiota bacterium]
MNSTPPAATVIVAVRDGSAFLPAALRSIREQSFADWECLVVDDASTDATPAVLAEFAKLDARFRILRREKCGGPFVAANEAARQARGEFLFRLDADDVAVPHRLAAQIKFLREHPGVDAAFGCVEVIDARDQPVTLAITTPLTSEVLRWSLCLHCFLNHSTVAFRRAAFLAHGGYAETDRFAQDYRLWCDWSRAGRLAVMSDVLVRYRIHPAQISAARVAEQQACTRRALRDHLAALTGRAWPEAEVLDLNRAAYARDVRLGRGLRALRRWQNCWEADATLSPAARQDLKKLSAVTRRKFVQRRLRRRPDEALWGWF